MLKNAFCFILLVIFAASPILAFGQELPAGKWWYNTKIQKNLNLSKKEIKRLDKLFANSGNNFFQEGDLATSMFVLEKGEVAIFRTLNGIRHKLRILGSGDCFGEMALMECHPRSATAQAVQDEVRHLLQI